MQMREPRADMATMSARAVAAIIATLAMLAASPVGADPAGGSIPRAPDEEHVAVLDDYFLPSAVRVAQGGRVIWDFTGSRTHTATDASGMGLFDSGLVAPAGPSFAYAFAAAGTYRYVCSLHETMRGRVWVVVEVSKRRSPHGRPIEITWATGRAPEGSVYDVQLRRPGRPWRAWLASTTEAGARFTPRHAGTFRVRARLRSLTSGRSEWSPGARFVAT